MNEWEIKFSEDEYEQMSNFARVAGFVSVRAAILSLFSLRRVKGFDKDWRYCPNCGMEATIESGRKNTYATTKITSLIRQFGAKLVWGKKSLQRPGRRYQIFEEGKKIAQYRGEVAAINRFCGQQKNLKWFLYDSELPWKIEYGDRSLRMVEDFFVVEHDGKSHKNRIEPEVVDFIVYGFRTESGQPQHVKGVEI